MTKTTLSDLARVHVRVFGFVQGVGFRSFVVDQFRSLGVLGWVRNVGYDQVEAVAEGKRAVLEKFAELVIQGPRSARVRDSRIEWAAATGEFKEVDVRY